MKEELTTRLTNYGLVLPADISLMQLKHLSNIHDAIIKKLNARPIPLSAHIVSIYIN